MAGRSSAASRPMMAITTRSSMSVKPLILENSIVFIVLFLFVKDFSGCELLATTPLYQKSYGNARKKSEKIKKM
jgi:hypothetical protein